MAILIQLFNSVVLWLGLYVFLHDFEKPKHPYLTLRYLLTWFYYLFYLILVIILGMGYSIPLRAVLSGEILSPQEAPLFYLMTGLAVVCLIIFGLMTRIVLRRRTYYRSVRVNRRAS